MAPQPDPLDADHPTRALLIEAAERLFAERDYEEVSVRAINAAAGQNAASVHYHFGSKEALVAAILDRRMAPLHAWREARCAELVAGGRSPTPRQVVDLLVRPLLDLMQADPVGGPTYVRLLARLYLGRDPLVLHQGMEMDPSWRDLVVRSCPHLRPEEAHERHLLMVDAAMVALNWRFARDDSYPHPGSAWDERAEVLCDFLARGFAGTDGGVTGRAASDRSDHDRSDDRSNDDSDHGNDDDRAEPAQGEGR